MRAGRATLERACPHEDSTLDTHAKLGQTPEKRKRKRWKRWDGGKKQTSQKAHDSAEGSRGGTDRGRRKGQQDRGET